jgi:type II secretory pathway pseudopilin PulG
MGITMLKTKTLHTRHSESGFSLLEMTIVVALGITLTAITFVSMVPLLQQQHVANAYNITMGAMRLARDNAVAQRTSYAVTFAPQNSGNPATVTVAPTIAGFQGDQNSITYQLPIDVNYYAASQLASTPPPDGFGSGAVAIDFGYTYSGTSGGGQTTVYFCPDGSSQNTSGGGACSGQGDWSGGVVYVAMQGNLLSSRALTLWGGTGRIHGWRLYANTSGGYQWLRQ